MSRRPLTADGAVELAVVERSGFDESRHLGAGLVVDATGAVVRGVGDVGASIYPRSSLKPFQALAVRRAGARFEGEQLVLTLASHAGTPRHQDAVRAMLAAHGNTPDDLGCPPALPLDPTAAHAATAPTRVAMECSGKHAGMLGACRVNGWDPGAYLDPAHPLQRAVVATVEAATAEIVDHIGVDGCGTPVVPVTLHGLARAAAGLVSTDDPDARDLVDAVLAHPWAVDGPGRPNAVTIERLGIVAKLGAEGVMLMGVPGRAGLALKVLDGNLRAATLAALELLATTGLVDPAAARRVVDAVIPPVTGAGRAVGRIRPGAGLR
ncbi:asparaginase [Nakamurella leprariae]|uniref:Asparaginase n=1 Tax=Nakamurella leprariae TaxID=2803911 RepID=A0A938YFD5_9ACTN|nr:asparaginase [Nakamurella leprariae]MBM9468859.1 asparaginase [Nakamurella leprariae]